MKSKYNILHIVVGCLACAHALADGETISCTKTYTPAKPGYDFRAHIGHWGQKKTRYAFTNKDKVGKVYINPLPIFDTGKSSEDNALYRLVDKLHKPLRTKPYVIRDLVLFKTGEPINNDLINESERLLRRQKFASEASILPVSKCGNQVDLEVITREVWTLLPEISFGTAGGKSEASIGVHDSNFLGTGTRVWMEYSHNPNRTGTLFHYQDDNFFGSRVRLLTHFENNSDGYVRTFRASLPFYELNARRAWGIWTSATKETDSQYARGNTISEVSQQRSYFDVWLGRSRGLHNDIVNRFTYGLVFDNTHYAPLAGQVPTSPFPQHLKLFYPYIQFQQVQNDYAVAYNINQINRVEDIHVGRQIRARFGVSGINGVRLILNGGVSGTLVSRARELFQGELDWSGRWNFRTHKAENARVNASLDYHHGETPTLSLHLKLNFVDTWNLNPESQVILGGATGLRGYPINYATGKRLYLFTAEQQWFTHYSVFSLYNVGVVGFFDVGRVVARDSQLFDDGVLSDVGLGLRFVPTKTDKDQVVHVDIGFPLKRLPGAHGAKLLIEVEKTI